MVSKELAKESIIVFDEAHNIDSVCIEAFSVNFNKRSLDSALKNVDKLRNKVNSSKVSLLNVRNEKQDVKAHLGKRQNKTSRGIQQLSRWSSSAITRLIHPC